MSQIKKIKQPTYKVKFYKDATGDWRWQIKYGANIIGASSEGYKNRKDCKTNLTSIADAICIWELDMLLPSSKSQSSKPTTQK